MSIFTCRNQSIGLALKDGPKVKGQVYTPSSFLTVSAAIKEPFDEQRISDQQRI